MVQLDLSDEETEALLNLLVETIKADRYPLSTRVRVLREIVAKCGEIGGLPAELAARAPPLCAAAAGPNDGAGGYGKTPNLAAGVRLRISLSNGRGYRGLRFELLRWLISGPRSGRLNSRASLDLP